MNKMKTGFVLLIAVLLVIAFALMPQAVAGISDLIGNEKPGTASLQSVELAFGVQKAIEPGYMLRKMALEQRMSTIPITPEQTAMTQTEAIEAAEAAMTGYVEAKVFEWFEYTFCSAEPYLGIDPDDKNNYTIFWTVNFSHDSEPYRNLFLHIDDQTGKILYIDYVTNGEDKFNYYYPEDQRLVMEGFVHAFLGPLALEGLTEYEYENLLGLSVTEHKTTDEVTCYLYTYEDSQYGSIQIAFTIKPAGFYVTFPMMYMGE